MRAAKYSRGNTNVFGFGSQMKPNIKGSNPGKAI